MLKQVLTTFCTLILCLPVFGTEYIFHGADDHLYVNPANWSPAYPGRHIQDTDKIRFEADVYLMDFSLTIEGCITVSEGIKVFGIQSGIYLGIDAWLDNKGEILLDWIENEGNVFNRADSRIHIRQYKSQESSFTQNLSVFTTLEILENKGRFDNYAQCRSIGDFRNLAVFNQIREATLDVSGQLLLRPGCILHQSEESTILLGMLEKVPVQDQIPHIFQ